MPTHHVDVAILGAGTAGLTARRSALKAGAGSVLMIDPGPLGTTCARVGCMPSKLLIAAADAAHHAASAGAFGVHSEVRIDGAAVMARVQRERDRFVGFVLETTDGAREAGQLLEGRARLVGSHTLEVAGAEALVEARAVVVATGSSPWTPPPFRKLTWSGPPTQRAALSTEDIFELPELPESVLVVGTGVIGLELGQALHRLGVRTTLVGVGGLVGPFQDRRLQAEAARILGAELDLHPDYELLELEEREEGVHARFRDPDGSEHAGTWQKVLVAAGRRPSVAGLGLEHAGLHLDPRGLPTIDPYTGQAGGSHVFFAGDVTSERPLLHEAADEGHIAGENAARYPEVLMSRRRTPLAIVFTDPNMAVVGQPWSELDCTAHRVGEVDYGDQGRARTMNQHRGLVRIYGECGTGRLLGAEMLGPRVEHTAHLLSWAVQQRMTVSEALAMPFYHPVVEEGIRTALRNLQTNLQIARPPGAPCEEFGPGD